MVTEFDPANQCTYPGCEAVFVPFMKGTDPGDGKGFLTGWFWPAGTGEDPELPAHVHVTAGGLS